MCTSPLPPGQTASLKFTGGCKITDKSTVTDSRHYACDKQWSWSITDLLVNMTLVHGVIIAHTHTTIIQSLKKIAILRGRNFCANFAFSRKITIFLQILPWRAIFAQICDLEERNLREDIYVFPLKFAFSVLGWHTVTSAKFT